jgi:hypothetical protein
LDGTTHVSVVQRAGFYGGAATLKSLIDSIRGPAEREVRSTQTLGFRGHVHFVGSDLVVGGNIIDPTDPFHDLIATVVGNNLRFDGLGQGASNAVVHVEGRLTASQAVLTFPSPGAEVLTTLPPGTPVEVTNLTLLDNYFEVQAGGQRGFVLASAVSIVLSAPPGEPERRRAWAQSR